MQQLLRRTSFPRLPRFLFTRPFGRGIGLVVSCALVAGFVHTGNVVLPRANGPEPVAYVSPVPLSFKRSSLPVFVMQADRSVVRHGTAELAPGDQVLVTRFESARASQPMALEPLLFESGLPVLWAAIPPASQDELNRRIALVQEEGARAVRRVITSQAFVETYRPRLSAMLAQSLSATWEAPRTQVVFQEFLTDSDPVLRAFIAEDIKDILLDRLSATLWEMARTNWANALGLPLGYEIDYTPVIEAVTGILRDPGIRRTLLEFGSDRLASPELRQFVEHMAVSMTDGMLKDPGFPALMAEMVGDTRLRDMLRPFGDAAASLAGSLPRLLGGLGGESSLNPLAAHVFRAFALGVESPLVLYVTPEDRRRIAQFEDQAGILLEPVAGRDPA